MRKFYLLRHCRTEYNEAGIVQGACDSPLSPRGRQQADDLGELFSDLHFDHVFTGNQGRHVETARRILERNRHSRMGTDPVRLPGLNEQKLGFFDQGPEEKLYDSASRLYEKRHGLEKGSAHTEDLLMHRDLSMVELASIFHDMDTSGATETVDQVRKRALSSLKAICDRTEENSTSLIVSSGGILAILLNALTSREEDGCVMPHGSCVVIREDDSDYEKVGFYGP